jgi:hypothetical protein
MNLYLRHLACLLFAVGFLLPQTQAQVINFENTWQEFLNDAKTSNVTKLPEPDHKSPDYLKYCLMYGNSHFCADELSEAERFMAEIKTIGIAEYGKIPRFKDRYDDLIVKIAAYHKLQKAWQLFLQNRNVPNLAEHEAARMVCEKGTLCKFYYMELTGQYCKGDIAASKKTFETRVLMLTEKGGYAANRVPKLPEEIKMMKTLFAGIDKLDPAWAKFIATDVSPGFDVELPLIACYPVPNIKEYILRAAVDKCKYGPEMLKKIKALQETYKGPIEDEVIAKIDWLEKEVGSGAEEIALVNQAWKEFVPANKLSKKYEFTFDYPCYRDAQIKAYTMIGTTEICTKGAEMVENIAKVRAEHKPALDAVTLEKVKNLEAAVKKQKEEEAALDKAWGLFTPEDKLPAGTKFVYAYCDKVRTIRAFTMTGITEFCEKGAEMMSSINKAQKMSPVELDATTAEKVAKLQAMVEKSNAELENLNTVWKEFIANKDTMTRPFELVEFYCDKIAQTKSWVVKGRLAACPDHAQGQAFLNKIDELQKAHNLKYDRELQCAVTRLRQAIWDCRYAEAVRQAQKETHEERERFGPPSAGIMHAALNDDKQPCETTVVYEPLGTIGMKYTINTFLCQKASAGKIGNPEYYKKIADWVNNEVLTKYCLPNLRCKKDFTIHLEGHTDGSPFEKRDYPESINIPKGTFYKHFVNGTWSEKTTPLDITKTLKGNMELGLARAWSVRSQLVFMNVPITIGAYEHPSAERGGQYRKVEIQLNITNLLLDYYEKRLDELVKPLGARPADCK